MQYGHGNTMRHMRFACWVDKAIYPQSTYKLLIFYDSNIYTVVPLRHGCKYIACLLVNSFLQILLLIYICNQLSTRIVQTHIN